VVLTVARVVATAPAAVETSPVNAGILAAARVPLSIRKATVSPAESSRVGACPVVTNIFCLPDAGRLAGVEPSVNVNSVVPVAVDVKEVAATSPAESFVTNVLVAAPS